ncbi:hypothetical protein FBZ98_1011021 [Rhizobium sp. ERR 922]|uniref:hypothetical protein n=1 Tax=unclassified Rhizobium TaxID=2613769 RepID=UPI0011A6169D|nr:MULTISPECIES: hypothetical protein [unclassified Rhizobium]TWB61676.1 hypothetical protein FBZ98_1011021 [Rhizobium sp. ERR 922]TWC04602.1 hypothetical protein FBZ97_1011021 [Rhizobium sp. ERR 942]
MKPSDIRRVGLKDEVIRLHFENPEATTDDIAAALGAGPEYVRCTFRRNGLTAVKKKDRQTAAIEAKQVLYSASTAARLRPFAERRGITVERLIYMLLQVVATDRMVDAILDDIEAA